MERSKVEAMIYLLDDSNMEIVEQIESQLMDMGSPIVPILEEHWQKHDLSAIHHERIFEILDKLKSGEVQDLFTRWRSDEQADLLEGALLFTQSFYPSTDLQKIKLELEKIRMDAWLQIQDYMSAWEKVRVLNEVFFAKFGFTGDREDYHHPKNSFLHQVLTNKKGNPISLSILYMSVAQKLNLPIFGVNVPQHFVMAFMPVDFEQSTGDFGKKFALNPNQFPGEPLFYLDAFSAGMPFDKDRLTAFLKEINIDPRDEFYTPCSKLDIIQRIARNLKYSFQSREELKKIEKIDSIIEVLS